MIFEPDVPPRPLRRIRRHSDARPGAECVVRKCYSPAAWRVAVEAPDGRRGLVSVCTWHAEGTNHRVWDTYRPI